MTKDTSAFSLDLTFCLGRSLFDEQLLSQIERFLRSEAQSWASKLCISRNGGKERRSIDNFAIDIPKAANERGGLHDLLLAKHGTGPFSRQNGSVELSGADNGLVVVLNLDEYLFAPSAGRWIWGNTVTVQIREQCSRATFATNIARRLAASACSELSPWYAHGHLYGEWNQKNVSREGGGILVKGLDISRYLPGLYWLNFFGEPYCELIGKDCLLTAPAAEASEIGTGVMLYLSVSPESWDTAEYRATEAAVLAHLGAQYFFDVRDPNRNTAAPDFGLRSLPRSERFS